MWTYHHQNSPMPFALLLYNKDLKIFWAYDGADEDNSSSGEKISVDLRLKIYQLPRAIISIVQEFSLWWGCLLLATSNSDQLICGRVVFHVEERFVFDKTRFSWVWINSRKLSGSNQSIDFPFLIRPPLCGSEVCAEKC